MTTVTESDLKELKDLIAALIQENREQFANLKKDVTDLKKDVTDLKKDVTDLKISSSKVEGTLSAQATLTQKIPDLIEKVGELKNWKQIAIITVTAVISGIITWFVRSNNLTL
jgi:predicted  nucleic acid-binding Zn-ribbon protein